VADVLMTLNKKQQKLMWKRFALIPEIVAKANSGVLEGIQRFEERGLESYLDGLFQSAKGNPNW
jgi:hypothetical protein